MTPSPLPAANGNASGPLTGRRVLALLIGFFLVIFAVNGVFIYVSLRSHPGTITDDAYREGIQFNRVLEQADFQRLLGWRGAIQVRSGAVSLRMTGATDEALTGLTVELRAGRPATDAEDLRIRLLETAPGTYQTRDPVLREGRWSLLFEVTDQADRRFLIEDRVMVSK